MTLLNIDTSFRTKAETLEYLSAHIKTAQILPLIYFTQEEWLDKQSDILNRILNNNWDATFFIVRSSSLSEDTKSNSNAGAFESVMNVQGKTEIIQAINKVFSSYSDKNLQNQVLIQPQLQETKTSGVIFTKDPNGYGDYLVINYDDTSHQTDTITSGNTNNLKCFIHHRESQYIPNLFIQKLLRLSFELEKLLKHDRLDIEFAADPTDQLYLFQVRPLIIKGKTPLSSDEQIKAITRISDKFEILSKEHPYLHGDFSFYGIMPDWNPAEIIGVKPNPLAFSLYRELVTDSIWAFQRNNYGYQNLRSFPLIVDFEGMPYVDIRVSFNSFIPNKLCPKIANRLVNFYLKKLKENPILHDKVEFKVIFSCYTFSLREKLEALSSEQFNSEDKDKIFRSLNNLTQKIVLEKPSLWKKDLEKIDLLKQRQVILYSDSSLDTITKMYWLIEDCKRYGTLPFAGLARVGFIAVEILKSLVEQEIFTKSDYDIFFKSIKTVSSEIDNDFKNLSQQDFLNLYGHLRPGTYDITSPSYEENPDLYFDWSKSKKGHSSQRESFNLSMTQLRTIQDSLNKDHWNINVLDFLEFIKAAIEAREYSKFIFTRSIHLFFKLLNEFTGALGFKKSDIAFLNVRDIIDLYSRSKDAYETILTSIENGKKKYEITKILNLPSLITTKEMVFSFCQTGASPNFITQKHVSGEVVTHYLTENLENKIVFIPSADPGFDWIFLKSIKALVTKYGGINSHMAIRANELGIPSIIGAGEILYEKWSKSKSIKIDCLNKQVIHLK